VRVTTPDLRRYVRAYVDAGDPFYAANREALAKLRVYQGQEVPDRRGWMVNGIFYNWGHRWIYDFGELRHTLTEAGFDPASVTQHAFAQGSEPDVAALDGEGRAHESIYVEARRPGS